MRSILPVRNSFVFFDVNEKSFHQASLVYYVVGWKVYNEKFSCETAENRLDGAVILIFFDYM